MTAAASVSIATAKAVWDDIASSRSGAASRNPAVYFFAPSYRFPDVVCVGNSIRRASISVSVCHTFF